MKKTAAGILAAGIIAVTAIGCVPAPGTVAGNAVRPGPGTIIGNAVGHHLPDPCAGKYGTDLRVCVIRQHVVQQHAKV